MATPQAAVAMIVQVSLTLLAFKGNYPLFLVLAPSLLTYSCSEEHSEHSVVPERYTRYDWIRSFDDPRSGQTASRMLSWVRHLMNYVRAYADLSLNRIYMMGCYNVPWVFAVSLATTNTAGKTKKSFTSVTFAVCCEQSCAFFTLCRDTQCSTIYRCRRQHHWSTVLFEQSISNIPHWYSVGLMPLSLKTRLTLVNSTMCACFCFMAATGAIYGLLCVYENKRRDRLHTPTAEDLIKAGEALDNPEDLTDGENKLFRYTY